MRTNFVLIDFESIQPESIALLEDAHFEVMVFVGASQSKVPFEIVESMQRLAAHGHYIKISGNGKNALDFHIAYYIGRLAHEKPDAFFHIISHDQGFDPLIQHLKIKKIFASRSSSIEEIPVVKAALKRSARDRADQFIEHLRLPKSTKPQKLKTLTSAIDTFFKKQLSEEELNEVIAELGKSKAIVFADNNKINYPWLANSLSEEKAK